MFPYMSLSFADALGLMAYHSKSVILCLVAYKGDWCTMRYRVRDMITLITVEAGSQLAIKYYAVT
jgi:hypothetical protein